MEVTVAANATATVHAPAGTMTDVSGSGRPLDEAPGVKLLRMEDGSAVLSVGAGNYSFVAQRRTK
jgi:alpha-L-rhamnosidase